MQVPPHPHMGLQTVSWLHDGEVLHRDSLGSLQTDPPARTGPDDLRPGHQPLRGEPAAARPLPARRPALGRPARRPPAHRPALRAPRRPARSSPRPASRATVILGDLDGADLARHDVHPDRRRRPGPRRAAPTPACPLDPDFEYAVLAMSGEAEVDGVPVLPGSMLYLGCGRTELPAARRRPTPA